MVVYSINDIEKLSGVKAHTLRMWEKRYNLLTPRRTETNIRYYLDSDLQFLLNVAFLNKRGIKISKIASMSPEDIKRKVAEFSDVDIKFESQLDSLTLAMFEFDEYNFNKILDHNIQQKGFKDTMLEIIYPLLDNISMMWIAGSVKKVHESFIVQLLRKKNTTEIEKFLKHRPSKDEKYLIYLPEGEDQELTLLFLEYLLKKEGYKVLNIGMNASFNDVCDAARTYQPDFIMSIFNESFSQKSLQEYIDLVLEKNPEQKFIASGFVPVQQRIVQSERCLVKNSLNEVIEHISG